MQLFYNNLTDAGTWYLNAGTTNPAYPIENLLDYRAAVIWKAIVGSMAANDLGAAGAGTEDWQFIAYGLTDVTTICLLLYSDDGVSFTTLGAPIAVVDGIASVVIDAADTAHRYWAIVPITSDSSDVQVSRCYIGPILDTGPEGDPDFGNYGQDFSERTNRDYSVLGQKYAEQRAQFKTRRMTLPLVPETTEALLRAFLEAVGTWKPFFMILSTATPMDQVFYGSFQSNPTEQLQDYGSGFLWRVPLVIEQQL